LQKELKFFIFIGLSTVFIDFFFYNFFISATILSINFAKSISFLMGTIFSYFMNRSFTFGENIYKQGSAYRFAVIYSFSFVLNVFSNALLYEMFSSLYFAYIIATGLSAASNFIGMKYYVFKMRT
jgi:putative flippase GtrA